MVGRSDKCIYEVSRTVLKKGCHRLEAKLNRLSERRVTGHGPWARLTRETNTVYMSTRGATKLPTNKTDMDQGGLREGGGKFSSVSRHQNPATHKENCRLSLVDSLPERKKPHTCTPREGHNRLCVEKIQSAPAVYLDQTTEDRQARR